MNLMSTANSYYRYKIKTKQDLEKSCFERRLKKRLNNGKKSFYFEVDRSFSEHEACGDFFMEFATETDLICVSLEHYSFYFYRCHGSTLIVKVTSSEELATLKSATADIKIKKTQILLSPLRTSDLKSLLNFDTHSSFSCYWQFQPYSPELKNSITVRDIAACGHEFKTLPGLEIYNTAIPEHYELEPSPENFEVSWSFQCSKTEPEISVIIPTYNNSHFLAPVIWHLINQTSAPERYEILVADDGSEDKSSQLMYEIFQKYNGKINLKYIYWSKRNKTRGDQFFFRSGLVRNLATRHSRGEFLFFLDSDMLVPPDFIEQCAQQFKQADILQFQRYHVHQELSKTNPSYAQIIKNRDTYVEESSYWTQLFNCADWMQLPFYWKYTCTYALGISRKNFYEIGLFKKYYISYGFEDTDLGYEAHKRRLRFQLVQTPLYHLTAYDQMQYKNSATKRLQLLRVTAELFFLQHLDPNIYNLLGNFYRSQKPIKSALRDLLS